MNRLLDSELILNFDGSIYHLGITPEYLSETIITVGDQDRVEAVAKRFDEVYMVKQNREFKTLKGRIGIKDVTVISTGIGTDNIDIVLNEIAFLLQFDLDKRLRKKNYIVPQIIRLGTSGSVSSKVELGSIVYSKYAISMDDLFKFYKNNFDEIIFDGRTFEVIPCSPMLEDKFKNYKSALTLTAKGFYAPQFRNGALSTKYTLKDIASVRYKNEDISNIEMETAGIYGLSRLLGFEAISINAILADRLSGKFSSNPQKIVDQMIQNTLQVLCK